MNSVELPTASGSAPANVDLMLIDDILPTTFSPFRTLEYSHYLAHFDAVLLTSERWRPWVPVGGFDEHLSAFPIDAALKPRIRRFSEHAAVNARLGYVTFLANAVRHLPFFESRRLPFVLQLYPGGAFQIDQPAVDQQLRQVLHSPLCRRVIATQSLTREYIIERIGCDPAKIEFIYGGVFDSRVEFDFARDKQRYPETKSTLDICFVAHKYKGNLTSKGYDQFIAIGQRLLALFPQLRLHVVGDYEPGDLPLGNAAERIHFYGIRASAFFAEFYPRMDLIVSVNRPFDLLPGAFDGFPTGACLEAGFRGVLNCINDPLGLNPGFAHGRDLILLDFDLERSLALLRGLLEDPQRLYELAQANRQRFLALLDCDQQLRRRSQVIAAELAELREPCAQSL